MIDFKNFEIKRGPTKVLHDPKLIVEEGCWYLSTDTAELFIGILVDGTPQLKPVNGSLIETHLATYATKDFVAEAIASIDIPEVDLTGVATEDWVKSQNYLTEHQDISHLAKSTELFSKDYNDLLNKPELFSGNYADLSNKPEIPDAYDDTELRNLVNSKAENIHSHSYNDLTDKPEIPSIKGLASEEFVNTAIANIEHPTNPTKVSELENDANYANETKVLELIENNASSKIGVSFTTDITVGHLEAGTIIPETMTLSELIYKIFVSEQTEDPDIPVEPDLPETSTEIIEDIIENNTPMYSVNNDGELVAEEFEIIEVTQNENGTEDSPTKSGFYELTKANGEVERGYQDLQIINDEMYYVIALPKSIDYYSDNVKLQAYDEEEQLWNDCIKMDLTCDEATVNALCEEAGIDIAAIRANIGETHTIWALEDTCTGSKLRYVIVE